jgi:hypothetical protein
VQPTLPTRRCAQCVPGNKYLLSHRVPQNPCIPQRRNRILTRPFVALERRPPRLARAVRIAVRFRPDQLMPAGLRILFPKVEALLFARRWQGFQYRADDSSVEVGSRDHADEDGTMQGRL